MGGERDGPGAMVSQMKLQLGETYIVGIGKLMGEFGGEQKLEADLNLFDEVPLVFSMKIVASYHEPS